MLPRAGRLLLTGLRLLIGAFFLIVAVALVVSVEIEERDLDCGVSLVAVVTHDDGECRTESFNQTLGATTSGALGATLVFGSRVARKWWRRVSPGTDAGPDGPPAMDANASAFLRRYRQRCWVWTGGGLVLLVVFTVAAIVVENRAEDLEAHGERIPGTVVNIIQGDGGAIEVSFVWRGDGRRERIHLDAESPLYRPGQAIVVLVDPDDPDHVSVPGETNQSPLTVWPMSFALAGSVLALITGIWGLVRSARQRAMLSTFSWRPLDGRHVVIPGFRGSIRAVVLLRPKDAPEGHVLTFVSMPRWRVGRLGFPTAGEFDVAGPVPGYVVIRAPASGALVSARPAYTRRSERRWRRAIESGRQTSETAF